jgi:hypothetical protein
MQHGQHDYASSWPPSGRRRPWIGGDARNRFMTLLLGSTPIQRDVSADPMVNTSQQAEQSCEQ